MYVLLLGTATTQCLSIEQKPSQVVVVGAGWWSDQFVRFEKMSFSVSAATTAAGERVKVLQAQLFPVYTLTAKGEKKCWTGEEEH